MRKQAPRLQFTDEERSDPALKHSVKKAEKAAKKADATQAKIQKKTVPVKERTADPATGRVTVRLCFEEVDKKKPPSKLIHTAKDAPVNAVIGAAHREVRESEQDNVGVEAAHKTEAAAETAGRIVQESYYAHRLRPYRKAAQAERRLEIANVDVLTKKAMQENPELYSNPVSRWQQKRAIKKQYAAAKRTGEAAESTAQNVQGAAKAAQKTAEGAEKVGFFVYRHRRGIGIVLGFLVMLALMLNSLSSCSILFEGVLSGITSTTYPSEDADMLDAEAAYAAMEQDLQYELDNYERLHPGYDEYGFDLDEIGHDPHVLMSILTAYHGGPWTVEEVQGTLQMLFEKQYILTETVETETRYRKETMTGERPATDPYTGEYLYDEDGRLIWEEYEYEEEVPYTYYICTVELDNFNLSHLPIYIMGQEQLKMYAAYISTYGNRPDLFPESQYPGVNMRDDYTDYDIPPEALEDEVFAAMITEAEKYLGYPYVWGGSSPSTSFDCSGFVSWVINHSGWDVGRLGAQGLLNICTRVSSSNARPGDLIFFQGTYDTTGASHVGIYVGNGMMIHCGDPISYANINSSYWQSHFLAFGRLP